MKKYTLLCINLLFILPYTTILGVREPKLTKNNLQSINVHDKLNLSSSAEFTQTNDGIYYKTLKSGSGQLPKKGDRITVHYSGHFLEKKMNNKKQIEYFVGHLFDCSAKHGGPFSFILGARQVISGWDKMLATMKPGEVRIVVLPSKEAYGNRAQGHIPANASLIFVIEFISAVKP